MQRGDPTFPRIECVDDLVVQSLRRLTPAELIAAIGDANRTARTLLAAGIRRRRPEWSQQQVDEEVARTMLDGAD